MTVLQKRLLSVVLAITFIFFIIAARLFYVQVIWGRELVMRASDQWNREIPVVAARGLIYDRNGTVIAGNTQSYAVFARPNAVGDKAYAAAMLAPLLGQDEGAVLKKLHKSGVSEVTLARQTCRAAVEGIISLGIDGIYYSPDTSRSYAYGDALCQVLGFTSSDGLGLSGIEKVYNDVLSGTDGSILYSSDIVGNLTDGTDIVYREAVDGDGIMLTIDIDIQLVAEQAVRRVCLSSGAESASCIVLDPNSFEVLAMVNYPSYDLNDIPRDEPEVLNSLSRNTIVCDIYEPGSTFKVVTAAANLQEYLNGNTAAFSPTYIFNGSRTRSVDGTTIRCWSDHANGKHSSQTLALALNNSCNPCFTDIALALGTDVFYDYLTLFGLGNVTGIDFAGEALGMLVPQSLVRDCDLARCRGFGCKRRKLLRAVACKGRGFKGRQRGRTVARAQKYHDKRTCVCYAVRNARRRRCRRQRKERLYRRLPRGGQDGHGAKVRKRRSGAGQVCVVVCRVFSCKRAALSCARHSR